MRAWTAVSIGAVALVWCGAGGSAAQDASAAMREFESLGAQFVQVRDVGVKTLSPAELVTACNDAAGKLVKLVHASSGDPSVKSKSQELLSQVLEFQGKTPESLAAYGGFLDTLDAWQGKDYAVMAVRRLADHRLDRRDWVGAVRYYDLLLAKYPDHASRAHALYRSGLACVEAKAYKDAVERFDQVAATDPGGELGPWALRRKAYAQAEQEPSDGDFAESMATLDELAAKYPTPHWKAYVYYRKGFTLARQERFLEALAEYWKGVNEEPSSPYTWVGKKHIAQLQQILETRAADQLARSGQESPAVAKADAPRSNPASRVPSLHDGLIGGTER